MRGGTVKPLSLVDCIRTSGDISLNNAPSSELLGGGYRWVGEELGVGLEGTSQRIGNC